MSDDHKNEFAIYCEDACMGARTHVPDNSVDLIITDPPYGIAGDTLHKHYNRDESFVVDGYIEVPQTEYPAFTCAWIAEAERVLRPGGSAYIVSGYTNLIHILNALAETSLVEMNHIIWKYSFGVYTKKKYVSSHYHILYYVKPGAPHTFHTHARYGPAEKNEEGLSANYLDREDVWSIPREYKPGKEKNKNELPNALLTKMLLYSSNEGDCVLDFFLGSFSTAKVAHALCRVPLGFELNARAYEKGMRELASVRKGELLANVKRGEGEAPRRQGAPWTKEEDDRLRTRYYELYTKHKRKSHAIAVLTEEFHRGRFAILNRVNALCGANKTRTPHGR